jgi:hypothetical protein
LLRLHEERLFVVHLSAAHRITTSAWSGVLKLFLCHDNLTRVAMESEQCMDITPLPSVVG